MAKKAVCILSGGMDSTVSLAIAKEIDGYDITALHFNYGQKTQTKELNAFREIIKYYGINSSVELDLGFIGQIGGSALTDRDIQVPKEGLKPGIPITYVPYRNGIFISIAAALAEREGAEAIYIGVVEEDSSGYPDCSEEFMQSIEKSINYGTKPTTNIKIIRPLVHLKKEQRVAKGLELGVPLELTWSCYEREDKACGKCDSCLLRLKGFQLAGSEDKIPYI
jgi:7-cyano-7-deazaguanine synthase